MSINKTFSINEIPINIYSVSPVLIEPIYNGLKDYIKTVKIVYEIKYDDITCIAQNIEDPTITLRESLEIPLNENSFSQFIEYENLAEEDFYPLAIEAANASEAILNIVKHVRIRTGLDIEPPMASSLNRKLSSFKKRLS